MSKPSRSAVAPATPRLRRVGRLQQPRRLHSPVLRCRPLERTGSRGARFSLFLGGPRRVIGRASARAGSLTPSPSAGAPGRGNASENGYAGRVFA